MQPTNLKEVLIEAIEAYAASKIAANTLLQTFASERLLNFLNNVDITPIEVTGEATDEYGVDTEAVTATERIELPSTNGKSRAKVATK
jgi:hypothetical protein